MGNQAKDRYQTRHKHDQEEVASFVRSSSLSPFNGNEDTAEWFGLAFAGFKEATQNADWGTEW